MNREIKFKGKTLAGFWVIGNLTILKIKCGTIDPGSYISNEGGMPFAYDVRPETVGQFTGLKDKNGKPIFEGDIIKHPHSTPPEDSGWIIRFKNFSFIAELINRVMDEKTGKQIEIIFDKYFENCEIIGSIHENPDLLK